MKWRERVTMGLSSRHTMAAHMSCGSRGERSVKGGLQDMVGDTVGDTVGDAVGDTVVAVVLSSN